MDSKRNTLISNVQKKVALFEKLKYKAIKSLFGLNNKFKSTPCLARNFLNDSITSSIEGSLKESVSKEQGQPFCSTPRDSRFNKSFIDENGNFVKTKKFSDTSSDAGLGDEQGSSTMDDSTFDGTITERFSKIHEQSRKLDDIRVNLSHRDILIKESYDRLHDKITTNNFKIKFNKILVYKNDKEINEKEFKSVFNINLRPNLRPLKEKIRFKAMNIGNNNEDTENNVTLNVKSKEWTQKLDLKNLQRKNSPNTLTGRIIYPLIEFRFDEALFQTHLPGLESSSSTRSSTEEEKTKVEKESELNLIFRRIYLRNLKKLDKTSTNGNVAIIKSYNKNFMSRSFS